MKVGEKNKKVDRMMRYLKQEQEQWMKAGKISRREDAGKRCNVRISEKAICKKKRMVRRGK